MGRIKLTNEQALRAHHTRRVVRERHGYPTDLLDVAHQRRALLGVQFKPSELRSI